MPSAISATSIRTAWRTKARSLCQPPVAMIDEIRHEDDPDTIYRMDD